MDGKLLFFGSKLVFIPTPTIKNRFPAFITVSCKIPQIFFFLNKRSLGHLIFILFEKFLARILFKKYAFKIANFLKSIFFY